jgi:hypothetical protein
MKLYIYSILTSYYFIKKLVHASVQHVTNAAEADINNGVVSYHKVAKHHYKDIPLSNGHQYHQVRPIGCDSFVFVSLTENRVISHTLGLHP